MKRNELLKHYRNKQELIAKRSKVEQEVSNKTQELEHLDKILYEVNRVTEIYQDVPLCVVKNVFSRSKYIESIDTTDEDTFRRDAHVCVNASDRTKYILYLIYYDDFLHKYEIFCGNQFDNEHDVYEIAKRWVALKELPEGWIIEKDRLIRQELSVII